MSKKAKIENYAKALSAIDRARASLDELEAQILEDTEADLDFVKAFVALPGEYVVHLSANQVAKILLSNAMARDGVSRVELAKKAELKLPEVTRILDVRHPTKIDRIEATLRSLGHRLQLSIA